MANVSKKSKQNPHLTAEEQREHDALALAELLFDIYQESKRDKRKQEESSDDQRQ